MAVIVVTCIRSVAAVAVVLSGRSSAGLSARWIGRQRLERCDREKGNEKQAEITLVQNRSAAAIDKACRKLADDPSTRLRYRIAVREIAALIPSNGFVGPIKRSMTIAGHQTSISLEPVFWAALERAAARRALPLSAVVAEIDALRIRQPAPPNLASTLRSWLMIEIASHSQ